MKRLSIIIPVYNSTEYLLQAIGSAENQTIRDKEIIIVDDGSDEYTKSFIQNIARQHENVTILTTENKGAGNARNVGIKSAQGKYVSFLDADDYYLDENALELMCDAADEHGKMICGGMRKMLIKGELQEQSIFSECDKERFADICELSFSDFQNDFCFQNYVFNRENLIKNKIRFPEFRRYQDPPFLLDAMLSCNEICVVPCYIYCYRYGHQDKTRNASKIMETLKGLEYTSSVAKKIGLSTLLEKNLDRLNNMYYSDCLENLSPEVLSKLLELNGIIKSSTGKDLAVIKDICDMGRENLRKKYNDLSDAFVIHEGLENIKKSQGWGEFLGDSIKTVSIYGLGKYGQKLIDSLENSGISIVSFIDKQKQYFGDQRVLRPEDRVPECDMIIISLANYRDVDDIPKYEGYNVQPLTELMWKYKRGEKPF